MPFKIATPDMTSDTTPSGICTTDQVFNSLAAFRCFDRSLSVPCGIGSGDSTKNPPHWVEYDFEAGQIIEAYRWRGYSAADDYYLIDWKFQGYDGSWVDLDEVTGNFTPPNTFSDTFLVDSPSSTYTKYRLLITDWEAPVGDADVVFLTEVELLITDPTFDLPVVEFAFIPQPISHVSGDFVSLPVNDMAFTPNAPSFTVGPVSLTLPVDPMAFTPNALALTFVPTTDIPSTTIYKCTLTGAPDAQTDLVLPISSMQARYRDGGQDSWMSVVVPNGAEFADEISLRPNGQIILDRGVQFIDGEQQLNELLRVDLEDIRDDFGGSRRSVTLSGHTPTTTQVPKTLALTNVRFRFAGTGKRRYRSDLDTNLRPGDTATFDVESIVVSTISYNVSTGGEVMEITEV